MEEKPSSEFALRPLSAALVYLLVIMGISGMITFLGNPQYDESYVILSFISFFFILIPLFCGTYVVGPNQSRAMVLFGKYNGTVRQQGIFVTNPFMLKKKVSLKAHNIASEIIKVNDSRGNPIEIGAVVVWQVRDTAQALFDVENYVAYIDIQIETAVRTVASVHPYDENENDGKEVVSLRGDSDQVANELQAMIAKRLDRAGIKVLESRISHLAYAPEIAQAMLQRQQAEAIISARKKIVEGAVGMVDQALHDLSARGVVELDDERKATMVSNLLVVLCGQENATPIINTGSLYQ